MASGGAPLRYRFVGREAEIRELGSELARSRGGELRCVILEGESGIGKTRLASEAAGTEGQGAITLSARGYPLGAASSFGLWAEAFDGYMRDLPPALRPPIRRASGHLRPGSILQKLAPSSQTFRPIQRVKYWRRAGSSLGRKTKVP